MKEIQESKLERISGGKNNCEWALFYDAYSQFLNEDGMVAFGEYAMGCASGWY